MSSWMEETRSRIQTLKKEGYFNSWPKKETEAITFFIYPDFVVPDGWIEKRATIYKINADKFGINPPKINFFIYPSIEIGKKMGLTPAITFVKAKEIHGHINQSPGHELTHVILGEINISENLPANGLWAEGVCVYFDGTNTDRKKHALSLDLSDEIINTSWIQWRKNCPDNLYPLAGSIVQYCVEKYGWPDVLNYIKGLKDFSANDETLCLKIFRVSYLELQNDWKMWLKQVEAD